MYLSYGQYREWGGTIENQIAFNDYEWEAESQINWYTFNRLKNEEPVPEEVQRCVFHLIRLAKLQADLLASTSGSDSSVFESGSGATIASQSNDGVSISYNVISASEAFEALKSKAKGNEIESLVQRYLQGVVNSLGQRVLYRGLYENE